MRDPDAKAGRGWGALRDWAVYAAVALACTEYLNARSKLVPKWGQWYPGDIIPYVLLQVRAMLSGRLALIPHPTEAYNDFTWGRGGMHTAWGLGVPILAVPFHLVGRLFGAPGFPDDVRFLVLYALVTVLLARTLHKVGADKPHALVAGSLAAGFVMVSPNFVGLVSARFQIYDQTIATGYLWQALVLAGVLWLLERCTTARLVAVCAAAGFSIVIRPPLGAYGLTSLVLAVLVAHRGGLRWRALGAGVGAYAAVIAVFFLGGNALRFGSPFEAGYGNLNSGSIVNRLTRWGLPFANVPFKTAAKEMFATLFLMDPVPGQMMMGPLPPAVQPYAVEERWREYYSPTYDLVVLAIWVGAIGFVTWRILRGRLWRRDRDLRKEVATVVGVWAIPPSIVLFIFYARVGNMVTRYLTDLAPAYTAAALCLGMAIVDAVRSRAPSAAVSAQVAIAGVVGLYIAGGRGWPNVLAAPIDRKEIDAQIASIDSHSKVTPGVPDHFKCGEPHGPAPVHNDLADWHYDCSFSSSTSFAMPHSPCVSFTFRPSSGAWGSHEMESLEGFRANADFDPMVSCGPAVADGDTKRLTMCDPRPPRFLLDGMRFYCIASLDPKLVPIDRLKLMRIDAARACPSAP
jgi:hypothetical protein